MKIKENQGTQGRLPAVAPLANPYVPFQPENPPQYEPRKALIRGTLFSGLDLPFKGMVNNTEKSVTPMTELQVIGFAIQELALYLDTHSQDKDAFALYQMLQKAYQEAKQEYEDRCGPLTHLNRSQQDEYKWLQDPWPWEYAKNAEA